jgi:hypothetical protein
VGVEMALTQCWNDAIVREKFPVHATHCMAYELPFVSIEYEHISILLLFVLLDCHHLITALTSSVCIVMTIYGAVTLSIAQCATATY